MGGWGWGWVGGGNPPLFHAFLESYCSLENPLKKGSPALAPPTVTRYSRQLFTTMQPRVRSILALLVVAHTDALLVGSATRLQHRRAGIATAGIFDQFKNAFMEKEAFDDRTVKGACNPLSLSLALNPQPPAQRPDHYLASVPVHGSSAHPSQGRRY